MINIPDKINSSDSSIIYRLKSRIANREYLIEQDSTCIENSLFDCLIDGSLVNSTMNNDFEIQSR